MRTCGIPQLEEVGRSLVLNVEEIAAWFDHRKTNAMLEGVNSLIQTIKRDARGFSNVSYLEASIYLRLGGGCRLTVWGNVLPTKNSEEPKTCLCGKQPLPPLW
jgi:hypothetical protein